MEDRGLELAQESSGKQGFAPQGGAESGAVDARNGEIDPDLALIIASWPGLPEAVCRQVVAMVRAAGDPA